ncbi:MAG: Alkylglycerone-phosphate synthase [Solirubrobacterales bacterium]|nr:Alkylglycerone-phosphate synthase [Solirubrobacterales bacterium]
MSATDTSAGAEPAATIDVAHDAAPTPRQRWWGWGTDGHDGPLPDGAAALLKKELGDGGERTEPVALEDVVLPPASLPAAARDALVAVVGAAFVTDEHAQRVSHAAGRSYPDLVRLRAGRLECAPDAVVFPADAAQVAAILQVCVEHGIAVVPFGGGSSVVGGVDALRGGHAAAICLDVTRLNALVDVDPVSQLATLGAGAYGPDAEALLGAHGLCLGHVPQSFEFSTVGGWVATRSSGQASTGYGRIDALVRGLKVATPAGEITALALPGTAAGPDLRDLLVGSEGTLGVITEATVRVRPTPEVRHSEAWAIDGFAAGVDAVRELEQSGVPADVTRLSDEEETRFNLAAGGTAAAALSLYLRARGRSRPCILLLSFDGSADSVLERRRRAARVLHRHGAVDLGGRPGAAWEAGRFHGPYLRDELMSTGHLVDTLETAAPWATLLDVYRSVGAALRQTLTARGTPPLVGCHVSHLYPTGASLYFTFLARSERGRELEQWRAAKTAAGDAIVAAGATITHHHAVGRDHAPWLAAEIGDLGLEVLRATKARLDPTGIMNPGKLMHGPTELGLR